MDKVDDNLLKYFNGDLSAYPNDPFEKYHRESVWHKNWKKAFPVEYREKVFCCQQSGELHRADVYTTCGTAIEFQNSPITLLEMQSREAFYPKMIWVLNGKKFKGFKVLKNLPNPYDTKLEDFEFCNTDHLSVIRKSELSTGLIKPKVLNFYHPELKNIKITSNFYHFCWKQPHAVWYAAKAPIYVDLGGLFLYHLKIRKQQSGDYPYLEMISRRKFIEDFLDVDDKN